jgi:hypothetical protein
MLDTKAAGALAEVRPEFIGTNPGRKEGCSSQRGRSKYGAGTVHQASPSQGEASPSGWILKPLSVSQEPAQWSGYPHGPGSHSTLAQQLDLLPISTI